VLEGICKTESVVAALTSNLLLLERVLAIVHALPSSLPADLGLLVFGLRVDERLHSLGVKTFGFDQV